MATCPNCGDPCEDGDYTHPECRDDYVAYTTEAAANMPALLTPDCGGTG
jgi:hypothetical protein